MKTIHLPGEPEQNTVVKFKKCYVKHPNGKIIFHGDWSTKEMIEVKMKENKFKYRENDFFDEDTTYVFKDVALNRVFESKVFSRFGNWWTCESLEFKATSIPCYKKEQTK